MRVTCASRIGGLAPELRGISTELAVRDLLESERIPDVVGLLGRQVADNVIDWALVSNADPEFLKSISTALPTIRIRGQLDVVSDLVSAGHLTIEQLERNRPEDQWESEAGVFRIAIRELRSRDAEEKINQQP